MKQDKKQNNVKIPDDFQDLLNIVPAAKKIFAKLSASEQMEYIKWIKEAKKEEARSLRKETAIEMILEGKKVVR